jgi:hypothetical protein
MDKVLHLTLKKKWFDMIASGEKTEEYREIKDYWIKRFVETSIKRLEPFKHFNAIRFKNGYSKNAPSMLVEFKGIAIGTPKPKWSDNWKGDVFIIKLGKILNNK